MRLLRNLLLCATFAAPAAHAAPVNFNFAWTGSGGYSLTGNFTYDSASEADGAIRDSEVTSLFFQGFLNGALIGTSTNAHTLADFNFNFNPVTDQFFLNGNSFGDSGQRWNFQGAGLGFGAGDSGSALSVNGPRGFVSNPTPLSATPGAAVPEPGSLALLALGLVAVGATVRKKRA